MGQLAFKYIASRGANEYWLCGCELVLVMATMLSDMSLLAVMKRMIIAGATIMLIADNAVDSAINSIAGNRLPKLRYRAIDTYATYLTLLLLGPSPPSEDCGTLRTRDSGMLATFHVVSCKTAAWRFLYRRYDSQV